MEDSVGPSFNYHWISILIATVLWIVIYCKYFCDEKNRKTRQIPRPVQLKRGEFPTRKIEHVTLLGRSLVEKSGLKDCQNFFEYMDEWWKSLLKNIFYTASIISLPMEYYMLILEKRARSKATQIMHENICQTDSWRGLLRYLFVWGSERKCEEYMKAVTIPAWLDVNLLEVFPSLLVRCLGRPLSMLSTSLVNSMEDIMSAIPMAYQIPVFLILTVLGFILIGQLLFLSFGYSLNFFWLSFTPRMKRKQESCKKN